MRMPRFKRPVGDEQSAAARSRVAQITVAPPRVAAAQQASSAAFGGWVPRVPEGAREGLFDDGLLHDGVEFLPDGDEGLPDESVDETADDSVWSNGGEDASPESESDELFASAGDAVDEAARQGGPGGRHAHRPAEKKAAGGAVVDRMPLVLRALWERWTPWLGRCQVELGRGHIVVIVGALVIGLGIAAVVYGISRPELAPVEAKPVSTESTSTQAAGGADTRKPGAAGAGEDSAESSDDTGGSAGHSGDGAAAGVEGVEGGEGDTGAVALVVHVAGKVAEPGVISLPAGSRVVDAIEAAGGVRDGVDLTPLNLARVLTDGEQVLVGVEPPAGRQPPPGEVPSDPPDGVGSGGLVSLNKASVQELETLPGIGPTIAQRIVDWRAQHGRFNSVGELHEISGIGPSKFADIEPLVGL